MNNGGGGAGFDWFWAEYILHSWHGIARGLRRRSERGRNKKDRSSFLERPGRHEGERWLDLSKTIRAQIHKSIRVVLAGAAFSGERTRNGKSFVSQVRVNGVECLRCPLTIASKGRGQKKKIRKYYWQFILRKRPRRRHRGVIVHH